MSVTHLARARRKNPAANLISYGRLKRGGVYKKEMDEEEKKTSTAFLTRRVCVNRLRNGQVNDTLLFARFRFGEHEGSYCTVASFEAQNNSSSRGIKDIVAPLQQLTIVTDQSSETTLGSSTQQQRSPSQRSSGKPSPASSTSSSSSGVSSVSSLSPPARSPVHHQPYRVGCFYPPNYDHHQAS